MGELFAEYLDDVGDHDLFGCCVADLEAAVVLECRVNGETFVAAGVGRYPTIKIGTRKVVSKRIIRGINGRRTVMITQ